MKEKIIKSIVAWVMVLITMLMIFNFSDEGTQASSTTSEGVIKDILEVILPEEEITPDKIQKLQFPVRKLAHFGIYMLLGFTLTCAMFFTFNIKKIFSLLISLSICFLYALLDEYHQSFTGRAQSFTDVLIDTAGALIGIVLFALLYYLVENIKKKKYKNPS